MRPLVARRGLATEKDAADKKSDFKGQLFQSTTDRVQREKQEQERFANFRNERAGGSSTASMLAGA